MVGACFNPNCIHASWPLNGNPSFWLYTYCVICKSEGKGKLPATRERERKREIFFFLLFFLCVFIFQTAPRDQKENVCILEKKIL